MTATHFLKGLPGQALRTRTKTSHRRNTARVRPCGTGAVLPAERLEGRVLLSAGHPASTAAAANLNVVYVESNSYEHGRNAILAYRRDPQTGAVTPLSSGPYLTGGTGYFNSDDRLGPDDSDAEVIASPDHRFLFAVNQGSNTIAVFRIKADGRLKLVPGAPFGSGGKQPVSLAISGNLLVVANRGDQNPGQKKGSFPNYTTFAVGNDGVLTHKAKSTVQLAAGASPSQVLVSRDGKFIFGDNLFARQFPAPPGFPPFVPPFASELESFRLGQDGSLNRAPGSPFGFPVAPPEPPFMLGLAQHPAHNIVYAGFVVGNKIGVFTYDKNGSLHFVSAVQLSGAGPCWITVSKNGKYLYAADSTSDSIDVLSLADPLHPVELQNLELNGPKAALPPPPGPVLFNTVPFQLSLDPEGGHLYVVSHEATLENNNPQGNALHVLKVEPDGLLTENVKSLVIFSETFVPAGAHPQGVAVL